MSLATFKDLGFEQESPYTDDAIYWQGEESYVGDAVVETGPNGSYVIPKSLQELYDLPPIVSPEEMRLLAVGKYCGALAILGNKDSSPKEIARAIFEGSFFKAYATQEGRTCGYAAGAQAGVFVLNQGGVCGNRRF